MLLHQLLNLYQLLLLHQLLNFYQLLNPLITASPVNSLTLH